MDEDLEGSPASGGEQLLDALLLLETRCRSSAAGLPEREARPDAWAGVLFDIGGLSLLAPLEEIGEVLEVPREATPIPRTRDWVFGVANNRGTLLPMFDLRAFLLGTATSRNLKNRVLVVQRDAFPVGLLVGDVTGIRHFDAKSRSDQAPELPGAVTPYVLGSFAQDEGLYPIFSVRRLTQDERFHLAGV